MQYKQTNLIVLLIIRTVLQKFFGILCFVTPLINAAKALECRRLVY
jgi:hypothetical protein